MYGNIMRVPIRFKLICLSIISMDLIKTSLYMKNLIDLVFSKAECTLGVIKKSNLPIATAPLQ